MKSADFIAKTESLTRELLLREILPYRNESVYMEERKNELLSDLGCISSQFDLEEKVVIYCFIRLWNEGLVDRLDFWKSFNDNRFDKIPNYIKQYYEEIEEKQSRL